MTTADIIQQRLINQQIAATTFKKPQQIVSWMVAMQAQEYAMAKWSIGLRLPGFKDMDVEKVFNDGGILRTHVMRPTWHFVTPGDIRWMINLTAPRINALSAYYYRKTELDAALFKKSNDAIAKALIGGKHLTRTELQEVLAKEKIMADGIRLSYIMMRAELDAIICSGPRQGKQFTYALLEERVQPVKPMKREDALLNFASRYFASRGPATIQDFAYWSGLSIKDSISAADGLSKDFIHEKASGKHYIFNPSVVKKMSKALTAGKPQSTFLMPDYDEYGMSYKDRSAIFNPGNDIVKLSRDNPVFNRMIIIDGRIEGTWKRTLKNNKALVETFPFARLSKAKSAALKKAVKRFCSFAGEE